MATEYGGAYGGQPWQNAVPPYRDQPPSPGPRRASRRSIALVAALALGAAGLVASLVGVASQVLPRQFTAQQQRQITDWEAGMRWRVLTAGQIFPASVRYAPPAALDDDSLGLSAGRVGIARQSSCAAATDSAVGAVLDRHGCEAMLRATYVDATDSYAVTVGVAAMPGSAQAGAAARELGRLVGASGAGVRTLAVGGTPAAAFTNARRQLSGAVSAGTYLVFYAVGYTDDRPRVPVAADTYADSEMSGAGQGVAQAVASVMDAHLPPPNCPGTPGC